MNIKDWPLNLFLKFYPEFKELFAPFVSDPEYIVRTNFNDQGEIVDIEIGYITDNWRLPEPKNELKD